jgi:3-oxoacyl-[acyl-carrier protein] reductase
MELAALERWPGIAERTAVVTGASRGIGRAIAEALVRQGATVIGTATTAAGADAITTRLGKLSKQNAGRILDVTEETAIDTFWEEVTAEFGAPTILVNNAGITRDNLLMRMKDEEWDQVLATNLTALHRVCKAALRGMMKARHGRVINISSVVGLTGNPGQANYAAAKAGMIGFSKSLAREVASRNITVNTVAPGFIDTDMTRSLNEQQVAALRQQIPAGRLGVPEDIAAAVVYLASDAAAYVTGETLNVNGGLHMQ